MADVKGPRKGNKTTELIVGTAALKMQTASKNLNDAMVHAMKMTEVLETTTLKVSDMEQKIEDLAVEYGKRKSQAEFDLELEFKTNEKRFAENYLTSNNLLAVSNEEYNGLRDKYTILQQEFEQKLNAEINKSKGILENNYNNATKLKEAEFTAKEAQNAARITSLESQLTAAISQADQWRTALDDERKAGVQRAQASAVGNINVTGPGK